jgi:hypothetical protein
VVVAELAIRTKQVSAPEVLAPRVPVAQVPDMRDQVVMDRAAE